MMKSIPKKLSLVGALTMSSVVLSACSPANNETTNTPIESQTKQLQLSPIFRDFNEALSADYASMRKKQISDVAYSLYFNIDHTKETYNGTSVIDFTMVKGNTSTLASTKNS